MTIIGTPASSDETAVRAKIGRMVDADTEPTLSSADLDDLVSTAARPDENGLTRADASWTPTWDVNAAAAEGWLRKAGKAAARFSFAEDGQRFDRAQIYAHCLRQHEMFVRTAMATVDVESSLSS